MDGGMMIRVADRAQAQLTEKNILSLFTIYI